MSELTRRLREEAMRDDCWFVFADSMREAADEIDKLTLISMFMCGSSNMSGYSFLSLVSLLDINDQEKYLRWYDRRAHDPREAIK